MLTRLSHSRRWLLFALIAVALMLLITWRLVSSSLAAQPPKGPPPVPVAVVTVEQLEDRGDRDVSAEEFIDRMRPRIAQVPGMQVFMRSAQDINLGAGVVGRSIST